MFAIPTKRTERKGIRLFSLFRETIILPREQENKGSGKVYTQMLSSWKSMYTVLVHSVTKQTLFQNLLMASVDFHAKPRLGEKFKWHKKQLVFQ